MSITPQYFSPSKHLRNSPHKIETQDYNPFYEPSNTDSVSDSKVYEGLPAKGKTQEEMTTNTHSEETRGNTYTLFMKLKGFPSTVPGSKPSQPMHTTLPYVNQYANGSDEILNALQGYKPKNDVIKHLFDQRPKNWKLHKYPNGIYYGEMANGRRHGKGILLRHSKGSYEGEWENDLKHGEGLEFASNGSVYEGQYKNGKPEGFGIFLWPNGEIYEGDWKNGIKHGHGLWKGAKGESYEGSWKQDRQEGFGVFEWRNGEKYEGEFFNFMKHGKGKEFFSNGDHYFGQYENGKPQGFGEYYWSNGSFYKGNFVNGLRHGKGSWNRGNAKSESYEGQWVNDKKIGQGIYVWENGDYYQGNFFDNLREGYGEMHYADGRVYKGTWYQGKQHGDGLILIPGQVVIKGNFEENKLIDGKGGKKIKQSFHLGAESMNLDETPSTSQTLVESEAKEEKLKGDQTERILNSEKKLRGRKLAFSRLSQQNPGYGDREIYKDSSALTKLNQSEIMTNKSENKSSGRKFGESHFYQEVNDIDREQKEETSKLGETDKGSINYGQKSFGRKLAYNLKNHPHEITERDSSEDLSKLTQSYLGTTKNESPANTTKKEVYDYAIPEISLGNKKNHRSITPVKTRNMNVAPQNLNIKENLASFEKFEPSGLTPVELNKWRALKDKLYSNLRDLEDLTNAKSRQKVRSLLSGPVWHPPGKVKYPN